MTPKWNDPAVKGGTMKKAALWLISEIGEGNVFTKEQLRAAFPGIAQADRRMRQLRDHEWVIHTNLQDVSLNSEEQRLVKIGAPVWERGGKKKEEPAVTAKQRKAALADSDYQCSICGIAGGETYPDAPAKNAVIGISKRIVTLQDGKTAKALVAECDLCRSGSKDEAFDIPALLAGFASLSEADKAAVLRWTRQGRRSQLDRVWRTYRRLPRDLQTKIRKQLTTES